MGIVFVMAALWALTSGVRYAWDHPLFHETAEQKADKEAMKQCRTAMAAKKKGDSIGMLRALGFDDNGLYEGDRALFWQLQAYANESGK